MASILESDLMREAAESCHLFWQLGWGECHAGNLSYLLSEEEVAQLEPYFLENPVRVDATFDTCGLEGR